MSELSDTERAELARLDRVVFSEGSATSSDVVRWQALTARLKRVETEDVSSALESVAAEPDEPAEPPAKRLEWWWAAGGAAVVLIIAALVFVIAALTGPKPFATLEHTEDAAVRDRAQNAFYFAEDVDAYAFDEAIVVHFTTELGEECLGVAFEVETGYFAAGNPSCTPAPLKPEVVLPVRFLDLALTEEVPEDVSGLVFTVGANDTVLVWEVRHPQ